MTNTKQDIERIMDEFQSCQQILAALGDETRQYLLFILLCGECGGSRVADIAKKTNLSRPAVSHHIQILKNAGIVRARKEGRFIYYYLAPADNEVQKIIDLFTDIRQIKKNAPDRSGDE